MTQYKVTVYFDNRKLITVTDSSEEAVTKSAVNLIVLAGYENEELTFECEVIQ